MIISTRKPRKRYKKMSVRSFVARNKTAGAGTNRNRPTTPRKRRGQVCDECPLSPRGRGNTATARARGFHLFSQRRRRSRSRKKKRNSRQRRNQGVKAQKSALPVKRPTRKSAGERQPRNVERGRVRKSAGKRNGDGCGTGGGNGRQAAEPRRTAPPRPRPQTRTQRRKRRKSPARRGGSRATQGGGRV